MGIFPNGPGRPERKCSSGSGGGAGGSGGGFGGSVGSASRSSKKQKQRKPPQRGLGVAQLERLRLEEQQKIDASSFYPAAPTFNFFCLSASLPNFRAESEFNPSSSLFRHIPSVPNMDLAASGAVPSQSVRNYSEYDAETRNPMADREVERRSELSLPLESYPVLVGHEPMQSVGSDHPPLLVNATSAVSMSLQSYQLEPPSNQSHHHGSFAPFRPQGEKMLGGGTKTSCPFSLVKPPVPHFPFKLPKMGNPIHIPEEPSSSGMDNLREGPSLSSSMLESSSTESVKENKVSGCEFLTLAPPLDTLPQEKRHYSQPLASSSSRSYFSYPEFEFPHYPGHPEALGYMHLYASGWTDQWTRQPFQQPYYIFHPPVMPLINVENPHVNGRASDHPSGSIDLDLKL